MTILLTFSWIQNFSSFFLTRWPKGAGLQVWAEWRGGVASLGGLVTTDLLFCCRCQGTCWPPGSLCFPAVLLTPALAFQGVQPRHRALHLSFRSSMKLLWFHSSGPFPLHCSGWCKLGQEALCHPGAPETPIKKGESQDRFPRDSGLWVVFWTWEYFVEGF